MKTFMLTNKQKPDKTKPNQRKNEINSKDQKYHAQFSCSRILNNKYLNGC